MATKADFMRALIDEAKQKGIDRASPIVPFSDWKHYYVYMPFIWRAEGMYRGQYSDVNVPAGFVTDLASVPQLFWSILPPAGPYGYAAIVHDYLYWVQSSQRRIADEIFYAAMAEVRSISRWKVHAIYWAVRLFGGMAWRANARSRNVGERRVIRQYPTDPSVSWSTWRLQPDVFADP